MGKIKRPRIEPSPAFGRNQISFVYFVCFVVTLHSSDVERDDHETHEIHETCRRYVIHRFRSFAQMTSGPTAIESVKICAICGSTHSSTYIKGPLSYVLAPTEFFARRANLNCLYYGESDIQTHLPPFRRRHGTEHTNDAQENQF